MSDESSHGSVQKHESVRGLPQRLMVAMLILVPLGLGLDHVGNELAGLVALTLAVSYVFYCLGRVRQLRLMGELNQPLEVNNE